MVEPQEAVLKVPQRRSWRRRLGCGAVLVLWFTVLLTPCLCIVLASQEEILIHLSDIPANTLRIWLVNEAHERGIGIAIPSLGATNSANLICVHTNVNFVFWEGEGKPTNYCECYSQPQQGGQWELSSSSDGECPS
jgi:hypothetical protein